METKIDLRIGHSFLPLHFGRLFKERFILVEGRRGTAKTRSILTILVARALQRPGCRILLARSTRTRLTETVLATLEEQVLPLFKIPVPAGGRENRHRYELPGGSALIPMGLDDPGRTQSQEISYAYIAEGTELESENDVLALTGAMRQNVPGVIHQCIVDCNPGPPSHWLNRKAEDASDDLRICNTREDYERMIRYNSKPCGNPNKWKRIITHWADNPGYWDSKNWKLTTLGQGYIDGLGYLAGHLRQRWLNGLWVAAEGSVYPEFSRRQHVITPFPIPDTWPWFCWYDPGYDHPTAVCWMVMCPNGRLIVADEQYQGGKDVAYHCRVFTEKAKDRNVIRCYGDPHHAFSSTAQSPVTIAEQAAANGLIMIPGPSCSNSREIEAQVNKVRELLNRKEPLDNEPMLQVFSSCENTIMEFESWRYKRKADGSQRGGDDEFEDVNDHLMDGIRGLVAANPQYAREKVLIE